MVNTVYVCRSCGYVFPQELSELIESNVQVYCEMCGTPFSLAGVEFKRIPTRFSQSKAKSSQIYVPKERGKIKFANVIKTIDKFDYIPLLIFAVFLISYIIILFLNFLNPSIGFDFIIGQIILLIAIALILIYDFKYIAPRIKSDGFNSISLDAFCYGILGCIIYGLGVIILIKGVLILIYNIVYPEEQKNKIYHFAEKLKNSLNNFSAKAGFIIIFLVLYSIFTGIYNNNLATFLWNIFDNIIINDIEIWSILLDKVIIIVGLSLFPIIILLIDLNLQRKIYETSDLNIGHAIGIFILGAIGTSLFSIGIFILLKGILLFLVIVAKPLEHQQPEKIEEPQQIVKPSISQKSEEKEEIKRPTPELKRIEEEKEEVPIVVTPELEKEENLSEKRPEKVEPEFKKEEEPQIISSVEKEPKIDKKGYELHLHESLLPVKNEKDRELVKQYFSKIFSVLSKDLREKVNDLDIPKNERKELLKELSFLTQEEQEKYLEMLKELYKQFPKKLIERIRKLKNVKPEHYDKIIEQLKYMDSAEQLEFIQFLENNA